MSWDQAIFDDVYNKKRDALQKRFGYGAEPSHVQAQGPYASWAHTARLPTIYDVVVYGGAILFVWTLSNMCIVAFERHFRIAHAQQDPAIQAAGFYTRRKFLIDLLLRLLFLPFRIAWAIVVFIVQGCARALQPFLSVYSLAEDLILSIPQVAAFLWRNWVESRIFHALLRWWRSLSKAAVVVRILLLIFGLWYWNREYIFISRDHNKSSYMGRTYVAPPAGGFPSHSQRPAVFSKVVDGTTVPNFGSAGPGFPAGARWKHYSDEPMTFDLWIDEHCTEVVPHHTFCYETPVAQLRPGTTETPIWKSTSGEPFPSAAITTSDVDSKPTVDSQARQTPSRPDSKHVEQTLLVGSSSGSSHSLFPGSDPRAAVTSTRTWEEEAQDNYQTWHTSHQEESKISYTSDEVHEFSNEASSKATVMLSEAATTSMPQTTQDHSRNILGWIFHPQKSSTSSPDHSIGYEESSDLKPEETLTKFVETRVTSVWGPTPEQSSESPETVASEIKHEHESTSSQGTQLPSPGSGIQHPLLSSESMPQPSSKATLSGYRPTPLLSRVVDHWPTLPISVRLPTWPSAGEFAWPTLPLLKRPWGNAESTALVERTPEVDYKITPFIASTLTVTKSQAASQQHDMKHRPLTPNTQFDERITEDQPLSEQGAKQEAQQGARPIIYGSSDSSVVTEEKLEEERSSSDSSSSSSSRTSEKSTQHRPATPDIQFDERLTGDVPLSQQGVKKARQGGRPIVREPSDSSVVTEEKSGEEQSSSSPSSSSEKSKASTMRIGFIDIPHVASTKKVAEPADAQPAPRPEHVTPKEELADTRYDKSASDPPSPEPAIPYHGLSGDSTGPEVTEEVSSTLSDHFKPKNLFSSLRDALYPSSKAATKTLTEPVESSPSQSSDILLDEDSLSDGEEEETVEGVRDELVQPETAKTLEKEMEHLGHAPGQHDFNSKMRGTNLEEHPEAEDIGESFELEYPTPEPIKKLHESVEQFKQDSIKHKFPQKAPLTSFEETFITKETIVDDGITTEAGSTFVIESTEKARATLKKQPLVQDESIKFDATLPDGSTAEFDLDAEDPSAHEEFKERVSAAKDGEVEFEFEGKATKLTRRKTATGPASGADPTVVSTGATETVKVETVDWKYCKSCRQAHCCEWEEDGTVRRLF